MTRNGNICLKTNDLSVGYRTGQRENQLLTNLDLTLREGEMICFMGPNGSGKSTLLRTLAGFQPPLAGTVTFPGSTPREQQVSVVLTDRVQSANLTVEEVVAFGRYPYLGWNIRLSPADREIVDRAIERVRIESLLGKKLYELSDGQLQMVMIARALAQDTPVLLLDEPTAHLDLNNRVEIMNLLRELSRTMRKAILLSTHELDLALQTADLIWLAGKAQTVLEGLPEDLVLNGAFDEIFQFKGFDLKSGKVLHQPLHTTSIQLTGEGAAYWWTKNALERNGFPVTEDPQPIAVSVVQNSDGIRWIVRKPGSTAEGASIERLLELL